MTSIASNFTQEIILPSKGLLNPEIPEGKLVQRCMMVADQKSLAGSNISANKALHQLINRTIVSPESFDVEKLTLPDTLYVLFKLRALSYGNIYSFKTRCPECGSRIDVEVNLSELCVYGLEEDYKETLVVTLPHSQDTAYIKLSTNEDLEYLNKEIKRRKKRNPQDDSKYVLDIVYSLEKIKLKSPNKDGKKELTHPLDLEVYVNSLTDLDAMTIMSLRDSIQYGIAPTIEHTCSECGETIDVSLQFQGDFFRPSINR